jgi:ADP-ribosyl-[dinitrogen reductase] hydrolase
MSNNDRFRGCLVGLAVGDMIGTTVEFQPRGTFVPLTGPVGGGPFRLESGQWTDDTSMALCLADSLLACGGFDARDQMERYVRWWSAGYRSSNGVCFDIGVTVSSALRAFQRSGDPFSGPTDPRTAGNGCLMRLAPIPMAYSHDPTRAIALSATSARTTHGATECVDASVYFGALLVAALNGADRDTVLALSAPETVVAPAVLRIAGGGYRSKPRDAIRGTGYVIDSLEAAIWCVATTDSFAGAVLTAANLGDDADTTAAICGQLAGALYGESAIPAAWVDVLTLGTEIRALADALQALTPAESDV